MRNSRSGSSARGSQFWPTAVLLLAPHRLAGELDQADDLLSDVAEEGLALGAPEPVVVARRALRLAIRRAWVQAEEFVDRALLIIGRARMEAYPTSAPCICDSGARRAPSG